MKIGADGKAYTVGSANAPHEDRPRPTPLPELDVPHWARHSVSMMRTNLGANALVSDRTIYALLVEAPASLTTDAEMLVWMRCRLDPYPDITPWDAISRLRLKLAQLRRAACDLVVGIGVHNDMPEDGPGRRQRIEGPVVSALREHAASASALLAELDKVRIRLDAPREDELAALRSALSEIAGGRIAGGSDLAITGQWQEFATRLQAVAAAALLGETRP